MAPKIVFLTGPPAAKSLRSKNAVLLDDFQPPFLRLFGPYSPVANFDPRAIFSDHTWWRVLTLKSRHLATGFSQVHGWNMEFRNAEFFSTQNLTFTSEDGSQDPSQVSIAHIVEELSQFYEESFAIHAEIPSSALPAPTQTSAEDSHGNPAAQHDDCDFLTSTSNSQFNSFAASMPPPMIPRPDVPCGSNINDVVDIPNANYLNTIQPQTMTVSIIVGIISISPPRFIKTRHGANVEIVEILVGDETKAGFGINFWLHPNNPGPAEKETRKILEGLRIQDIVLFKNIALASFKGKVFGQSLRKDMTKIHLLYRKMLDRHDFGGCYRLQDLTSSDNRSPQAEKSKIVREWVLRFVGGPRQGINIQRSNHRKDIKWEAAKEVLPPDTQ